MPPFNLRPVNKVVPAPRLLRTDETPATIQAAIVSALRDFERHAVVSTNCVMLKVRESFPDCPGCSNQELADLIRDAAILLGLIPVFDPHLAKAYEAPHLRP